MTSALPIPGFVDLQVNGYVGVDFSSAELTEDAFVDACRRLRATGTAAFLPTVISSPVEIYERNLPLIAGILAREEFRAFLPGLHIEGPFISGEAGAVGAHPREWVRAPDVGLLKQMIQWAKGCIRLLTISPELPGAILLTREATAAGIVVSVGHTLAGPRELALMADAGARVFTHLGNALPAQLPKFDNPIWAGLADNNYTAMFIADGHHVPDAALKAMIRAKGVPRVAVTSDASPVAGMPPGRYHALGNEIVLEASGRLHNPQKGCLVGSSATLLGCMNHLASLNFLSREELLAVGFDNPLRLIGVAPAELGSDSRLNYDSEKRAFSCEARSDAEGKRPV